jgi:hypothetical protein
MAEAFGNSKMSEHSAGGHDLGAQLRAGRKPHEDSVARAVINAASGNRHSGLRIFRVDAGLQVLGDIGPELFFERSQRCQEPWTVKGSLLPSRILGGEFRKILLPIEHVWPPRNM